MHVYYVLQGHVPIAVVATSGTTVLGAFDDLVSIADVCEMHRLWMHVDVSVLLFLTQSQWPYSSYI